MRIFNVRPQLVKLLRSSNNGKKAYADISGFFDEKSYVRSAFSFEDGDFGDKNRMSDPVFKSIGYPSKIYYKNIQKYITFYTEEGGIVLDTCAGSGSTGIAALLEGRRAVLMDDSTLAVNMEYNLVNYVDLKLLEKEYEKLVKELTPIINGIYYTKMSDGYADVIIASKTALQLQVDTLPYIDGGYATDNIAKITS